MGRRLLGGLYVEPRGVALQQLGLHRATDLVGGYQALRAAGLVNIGVATAHFRREANSLISV